MEEVMDWSNEFKIELEEEGAGIFPEEEDELEQESMMLMNTDC